jgi:hypothetical protein
VASFGGSSSVEIDAPMERCYEVAADIEGAPGWQGSMKSAEILERDDEGRASLVEAKIEALVASVTVQLRFSYDPPNGLRCVREGGDLKSLWVEWSFEDLGGGRTLATYEQEFDPGRMLSMLAKGPVVGKVRRHLSDRPPRGLKQEVERP